MLLVFAARNHHFPNPLVEVGVQLGLSQKLVFARYEMHWVLTLVEGERAVIFFGSDFFFETVTFFTTVTIAITITTTITGSHNNNGIFRPQKSPKNPPQISRPQKTLTSRCSSRSYSSTKSPISHLQLEPAAER